MQDMEQLLSETFGAACGGAAAELNNATKN